MGIRFSQEAPPLAARPRSRRYRDTVVNENGHAHLGDIYVQGDLHYRRSSNKRIERTLEVLIAEFRKTQSHESIRTYQSLSTQSSEDWRALRKYLKDHGITGRMAKDHQDLIIRLLEVENHVCSAEPHHMSSVSLQHGYTSIPKPEPQAKNLEADDPPRLTPGLPSSSSSPKLARSKVMIISENLNQEDIGTYVAALMDHYENTRPDLWTELSSIYQTTSTSWDELRRKNMQQWTELSWLYRYFNDSWPSLFSPSTSYIPTERYSYPPWLTASPVSIHDHIVRALCATGWKWKSHDNDDGSVFSCRKERTGIWVVFFLLPYGILGGCIVGMLMAKRGQKPQTLQPQSLQDATEAVKTYLARELICSKLSILDVHARETENWTDYDEGRVSIKSISTHLLFIEPPEAANDSPPSA